MSSSFFRARQNFTQNLIFIFYLFIFVENPHLLSRDQSIIKYEFTRFTKQIKLI